MSQRDECKFHHLLKAVPAQATSLTPVQLADALDYAEAAACTGQFAD